MTKNDNLGQIVDGCKAGSAESFSQLVDIYGRRCYGYFYRMTGNAAVSDELLSELFVKLVTKMGTYRSGSFESWLFRIASNIFHDYLRGKQRHRRMLDAQKRQLEEKMVEPRWSDTERIDKLQIQLEKLDSDTRELIMLRFYSQMKLKEVAAARSEPIGTTLSKLHRGLKRLREMMEA